MELSHGCIGFGLSGVFWVHSRRKVEHTHAHEVRMHWFRSELMIREIRLQSMMNEISLQVLSPFSFLIVSKWCSILFFHWFTFALSKSHKKKICGIRRQESARNQFADRKGWKLWNRCINCNYLKFIWPLWTQTASADANCHAFSFSFHVCSHSAFAPRFARFIVWAHVSRLSQLLLSLIRILGGGVRSGPRFFSSSFLSI